MNCPHCKSEPLEETHLDGDLPALTCHRCEGNWISSQEYWSWLERHGPTLPEQPYEGPELEIDDTQQALLCPACKRIMLRYKVGHETDVVLDHCSACNGMWFDRKEWRALRGRNLHDEVHLVFTAPWQRDVRREEARRRMEQIYEQRFGADYDEVKRIREWIDSHPKRDLIVSFLTDRDPYEM